MLLGPCDFTSLCFATSPAAMGSASSQFFQSLFSSSRAIGEPIVLPCLIPELQQVQSETLVRVLEVELEDGSVVVVPRANIEMIEQ